MRFEATIDNGRRLIVARDFPADYEHLLIRGLGFVAGPDAAALVWEYPSYAEGWEDAARNWVNSGSEMLDQRHGRRPIDWESGLHWIAGILDDMQADWFLIGSASLAVRGMSVAPGGVDVAVDEESADRMNERIGAGVMLPVVDSGGWPVATRTGTLFYGCSISVIGGMHEQQMPTPWDAAARAALDTVVWQGRELRVPPLASQLRHARNMYRNDHVRAILAFNAGNEPIGG
jgi:hypothetical protein